MKRLKCSGCGGELYAPDNKTGTECPIQFTCNGTLMQPKDLKE